MKKNSNLPSWQGAAAVGVLSTTLIAIIQSGKLDLLPDDIKLYTSLSPAFCALLVTLVNWGLAVFNIKSPSQIRAEYALSLRISSLESEIIKGKKLGIDTSKLKSKYQEAVIARDRLYEQSAAAVLTGE